MNSDISIGGIFMPRLLVLAFIALPLAGLSSRMLGDLGVYWLFAHRPLVNLSLFVICLGLLVQIAIMAGITH